MVPLATTFSTFATANGVSRSRARSITGLLLRCSTSTQAASRTTAATSPITTSGAPQPLVTDPAEGQQERGEAGAHQQRPGEVEGGRPVAGGDAVRPGRHQRDDQGEHDERHRHPEQVHRTPAGPLQQDPAQRGPMAKPSAAPIWNPPRARLRACSGASPVTSAGAAPSTSAAPQPWTTRPTRNQPKSGASPHKATAGRGEHETARQGAADGRTRRSTDRRPAAGWRRSGRS